MLQSQFVFAGSGIWAVRFGCVTIRVLVSMATDGEGNVSPQSAILFPQRRYARYISANRRLGIHSSELQAALEFLPVGAGLIVGIGPGLASLLGCDREELRCFPAMSGKGIEVPSTQSDLWLWVNAEDPRERIDVSARVTEQLSSCFSRVHEVDGFKHDATSSGLGRDLTGYEDGTENPNGPAAKSAALADDGSSFVAVQQWKHDLLSFVAQPESERDRMIGRRQSDNEELDDASESAHVKRIAQESFDPEAWVLRRSLPWSDKSGEGLMFVAFGKSFDAFEVQMRRMAGLDDGVIDACFRFSRPQTGGYFWCPPVADGRLELRPSP